MATLFFIIFLWQRRIEEAGYFANIFRDVITDIETARLSQPFRVKWDQAEYWYELTDRPSARGQEWIDQNPKPEPGAELTTLAGQRPHRTYALLDVKRLMQTPPPFLSSQGRNVAAAAPTGDGFPETARQDEQRFEALLESYRNEVLGWVQRASSKAWNLYQGDLESVREQGREQAKRAISVDLSALRGRGPEFVLEFTAIVVIIFAATILGVMHLLGSEQIGTLLAAIAGYVLGKSISNKTQAHAEEVRSAQARRPEDQRNGGNNG
ncbi:hypothetical protein BRSPCE3_12840 [Bradyrhizobium sp. Ce-3]|nr:hypothetical protein BRSPCE3_12840 [Bradyrhizobium sp. Ce-3]